MPDRCFTRAPERRAPAADAMLDPSRTRVLRCSSPWAIKNVVFSQVLGVMAPMVSLVAWSGRLGHQEWLKTVPETSLSMGLFDDLL